MDSPLALACSAHRFEHGACLEIGGQIARIATVQAKGGGTPKVGLSGCRRLKERHKEHQGNPIKARLGMLALAAESQNISLVCHFPLVDLRERKPTRSGAEGLAGFLLVVGKTTSKAAYLFAPIPLSQ
jgi:hypothetical protein